MKLRPYQPRFVDAMLGALVEFDRVLGVAPTGSGKTVVSGEICRRCLPFGPVLFLADAQELVKQAADKLGIWAGVIPQVEMAEEHAQPGDRLVVATTQSLARRLGKWPRDYFSLVIVDECFPAGTRVDGRPIETLRAGDLVDSWNETTGSMERRRIRRVIRQRTSVDRLVKVRTACGLTVTATINHPFAVVQETGPSRCRWTPAGLIEPGDEIYVYDERHVRSLSESLRSHRQPASPAQAESDRPVVLFPRLPECAHVGAPEGSQPDVLSQRGGEGWPPVAGNRAPTTDSWGEWHRSDAGPEALGRADGLAHGVCSSDEDAPRLQLSDLLQTGPRRSGDTHGGGGGRRQSQGQEPTRPGYQESRVPRVARVVLVEVYQPRGAGGTAEHCQSGAGSGEVEVFNLTVEGLHTYVANGFVVHNCHRNTLGTQAQAVLGHFASAQVIGITATPFRSDKQQLATFYQTIPCEISLVELIKEGYLARIVIQSVPVQVDLSAVKTRSGDFREEDLGDAIEPHLAECAEILAEHARGRRTVVFLPLIETSKRFVAACREIGLRAVHVDGEDRSELETFRRRGADIICNASLLTTGWDEPSLDCVMVLRPTKSLVLYSQMIGRGTRIHPGKENLLVLDPLFLSDSMDLIRPARLIAQTPQQDQAMTEVLALGEQMDLLEVDAVATEERRRKLAEQLAAQAQRNMRVVDAIEFAVGLGSPLLLDYEPTMAWEREPVSPKQAAALERMGFGLERVTCKGHANKLLEILFARRDLGLATPKQVKWLVKLGHPDPYAATFAEAGEFLDRNFGGTHKTRVEREEPAWAA